MAVINTNTSSLNAQRNLNSSATGLATSLQRLSSGLRINSAKDDAAGLAISERMTSQIRGTTQAARNANDGISLAQTAEGDLTQIGNNLQRMRELAVQSANGTNTGTDRAALDKEVQQLSAEIDRVAAGSSFNGVKLLDGSLNSQKFQVGANAGETIAISGVSSARTQSLGQFNGVSQGNIGAIVDDGSTATLNVALTGTGSTSVPIAGVAKDAKAIAAALNNSGISGLSATADSLSVAGSTTGAAASKDGAISFKLNGVNISTNVVSGSQKTTQANAMSAINAQSASTGVVATDDGTGMKLTSADGRNISFSTIDDTAATTGATFGDLGLGNITGGTPKSSTVKVDYVAPEGAAPTALTIDMVGVNGATSTTPVTKSFNIQQSGTAIAATDVLTQDHATAAIKTIDAALASVNSSRANLGAVQNRFSSVVTSLQTTTENLSASRSRIQDTDFAAETANLTRGQILQQAGTAMLAQANSLPNGVLSLLRG